jgi:hypothetical protein
MPSRRIISRERPAAQAAGARPTAPVRYRIRDVDSGTLRAFERGFCANNGFFVKTHGDSEQDTQTYRWYRPHEGGADDFKLATKEEVRTGSLAERLGRCRGPQGTSCTGYGTGHGTGYPVEPSVGPGPRCRRS